MSRLATIGILGLAAFALGLGGCGSRDSAGESDEAPVLATVEKLPVTLNGVLELSVWEGDSEEGEGEIAFGSLKVGGKEYSVEVAGTVVTEAGIPDDAITTNVSATLSRESEYIENQYVITRLTKR